MYDVQSQRTHAQTLYYIVCVIWLALQRGFISGALAFAVVVSISIYWHVPSQNIHNLAVYKIAKLSVARDQITTPFRIYTVAGKKVQLPAFSVAVDPYQRASAKRTLGKITKYIRLGLLSGSFALLFGFAGFIRGVRQ